MSKKASGPDPNPTDTYPSLPSLAAAPPSQPPDAPPSPDAPHLWAVGQEGPLRVAVLFVDLVSSSEFSSVLGLREYANYVEAFQTLAAEQCRYMFEEFLRGRYLRGVHYAIESAGDELAVFLHTGKPDNDVYQLLQLAITLKAGWLGAAPNAIRLEAGQATAELAAGVNTGLVWARRTPEGFVRRGFVINAAKRAESASREGHRYRIFATDSAFKQVNLKLRNILFSKRRIEVMKGVVVPMGVFEIVESFINVSKRLSPDHAQRFESAAHKALETNSFDAWIFSCLQVAEEARDGCVNDNCLTRSQKVLAVEPTSAVALYYAAQGMKERKDYETAILYLEDLVKEWPQFGDGWLELARAYKTVGDPAAARKCVQQARRRGIGAAEEELPESNANLDRSRLL